MVERVRLKFVALGDSLTVGFQPPSMFLSRREEFPYTQFLDIILSSELPKKGLSHVEIVFKNMGMLGDTTHSMLERFDYHVAAERPDYVIVWGGINDLFMLKTPENIIYNLKLIYRKAIDAEIEPVACTVTSVLGYDHILSPIVELNDLIKGYCMEQGIPIADLFSATSDESGRLREAFSDDGVHLSYAGYKSVARIIGEVILELISERFG